MSWEELGWPIIADLPIPQPLTRPGNSHTSLLAALSPLAGFAHREFRVATLWHTSSHRVAAGNWCTLWLQPARRRPLGSQPLVPTKHRAFRAVCRGSSPSCLSNAGTARYFQQLSAVQRAVLLRQIQNANFRTKRDCSGNW